MTAMAAEQTVSEADGYIGCIPVRNLWLLMLYASDLFRNRGIGKVGLEDSPDELPDLVAQILADAVERRQRRRLNLGYRSRDAVLNRVRGRIDVLTTQRHQLLDRGLVACRFEELTIDTLRNRFVRAALESISRIVRKEELAHRCRSLANGMKAMGVFGIAPTPAQMSTDCFGRNDAADRFMVDAAKLAFDLALPNEEAGANVLALPEREVTWVRKLFEKAVGGFYAVVLQPQGWHVSCGGRLKWQVDQSTSGIEPKSGSSTRRRKRFRCYPRQQRAGDFYNHIVQKRLPSVSFGQLLRNGFYMTQGLLNIVDECNQGVFCGVHGGQIHGSLAAMFDRSTNSGEQ